MNATKQSVSLPSEMNAWLESEMIATRRSRSSLIQEALEMMRFARLGGKSQSSQLRTTAQDVCLSKNSLKATRKQSSG